ncbi:MULTISPECIES: alpha/beta hydrolase [unclassified Labrenzia]|uniref:alpha/beta fold hydrolase n=1 Tax=unclassified Labrenzia TaxID=2648686 RepID=UPI001267B3F4|nr:MULTISPECIES: alpha/beta hydrolase [unclassified Labrenzia]
MATELTDGRSWVLLPGTLCTGAVFDAFLDALAVPARFRHVVSLRHPNVEDYRDELQAKCAPGSIVCGFSLGAIVAAHFADCLCAKELILFGLNPHADRREKRSDRIKFAQDVHCRGGAIALASCLQPLAGPQPSKARETVLKMADDVQEHIDAQTQLALSRPGAIEPLLKSNLAVSLLTGTEDMQAPLALARDAANAAPFGRVVPLVGLGHYAVVEDPVACSNAVRSRFSDLPVADIPKIAE